jgi:hypothetical protein
MKDIYTILDTTNNAILAQVLATSERSAILKYRKQYQDSRQWLTVVKV